MCENKGKNKDINYDLKHWALRWITLIRIKMGQSLKGNAKLGEKDI